MKTETNFKPGVLYQGSQENNKMLTMTFVKEEDGILYFQPVSEGFGRFWLEDDGTIGFPNDEPEMFKEVEIKD